MGGMSLFRDDGIVLRTQKLGEADRIITLLTRGHGRVRAVARGVRRTKSKFGARLEPFSHVDVQFFARGSELIGRGLPLCTQSETIAPYGGGIVADYARYTAGTAMLETAERFTDHEGEPAVQQYLLLVGGLRTLAAGSMLRISSSTRSCCVRSPSTDTRQASVTVRSAGCRDRTGSSPWRRAGWSARTAEWPGASYPHRRPWNSSVRCLRETGRRRTRARRGMCGRAAGWCPPICTGTLSAGSVHCGTWRSRSRA